MFRLAYDKGSHSYWPVIPEADLVHPDALRSTYQRWRNNGCADGQTTLASIMYAIRPALIPEYMAGLALAESAGTLWSTSDKWVNGEELEYLRSYSTVMRYRIGAHDVWFHHAAHITAKQDCASDGVEDLTVNICLIENFSTRLTMGMERYFIRNLAGGQRLKDLWHPLLVSCYSEGREERLAGYLDSLYINPELRKAATAAR